MSAFQPYIDLLKEKFIEFKAWLKPDISDPIGLQIVKLVLKIPLVLLAVLLSPIAIVLLLFAFIAAF